MLLKKQTVWLLTMLSLVIILSVYYVTTPVENQNQLANNSEEEKESGNAVDGGVDGTESEPNKSETTEDGDETSVNDSDSSFETLRMEITDERNQMIEDLTIMVSNTDLSAKERNVANEEIKSIRKLKETEELLETLIKSMNYDDALVQVDGSLVKVTVKTEEMSTAKANEIIRLVNDEVASVQNVTVKHLANQ